MTKTTIETVTKKQIGQLNREAAQAGDGAMVDLTQSVIDSWRYRMDEPATQKALIKCVAAISGAEMDVSLVDVKELRASAEDSGDEVMVEICDELVAGWPNRYSETRVYSALETVYYELRNL